MSEFVFYDFYGRGGAEAVEASIDQGATFADLRAKLEATGVMDTLDRFARRASAPGEPPRFTPIPRDAENAAITDGMGLRLQGPRRPVTLSTPDAELSVFVRDADTVRDFRGAHGRHIPPQFEIRLDGVAVAKASEATLNLEGVKAISVGVAVDPAPEKLPLLLLTPKGDPQPLEWENGSLASTLSDLRRFLGGKAEGSVFTDAAGQPVDQAMEDYETVATIEPPGRKPGDRLRVRLSRRAPSRASGLGDPGGGGSAIAIPASGSGASGAAGGAELRRTRDNLGLLGDANSSGAPRDWFDGLPSDAQESLLRSFRHLHGLRFTPSGQDQGGPAFELERSIRPVLVPVSPDVTAIRVALPMTTTRYSASASETLTLDSVRAMLSWNVGSSVGVEGKAASVALKTSYTQTETDQRTDRTARLVVRVEYLVARGEIVVDPEFVSLHPELIATLQQLKKKAPGPSAAPGAQESWERRCAIVIAQILDLYGPYVPMRTLFGGKLIYRQEQTLKSSEVTHEKKRKFASDLEATVKQVTLRAEGGFSAESQKTAVQEFNEQAIEVTMAGGDPALAMLPYRWADSLDHHPWWAVIGFADVRPTLSLLPQPLLDFVTARFARNSDIAGLLSGPLDWERYVAGLSNQLALQGSDDPLRDDDVPEAPPSDPAPKPSADPVRILEDQ